MVFPDFARIFLTEKETGELQRFFKGSKLVIRPEPGGGKPLLPEILKIGIQMRRGLGAFKTGAVIFKQDQDTASPEQPCGFRQALIDLPLPIIAAPDS